jgi:CTP:molybdopterin cytidylyltransferase MocA
MPASVSVSGAAPVLVVLAAGASVRLGRCKALVEIGGGRESSPLARLLAAGAGLAAGFAEPAPLDVVVVTGAAHDEIAAALHDLDAPPTLAVELARNARWAEGRGGSVLAARAARPGRDFCIAPVDVPLVRAATFRALGARWRSAGTPPRGWLAPRGVGGRTGHPVVLGRELLSRWSPPGFDTPLRELRAAANPLLALDVDDPGIHDDLDTPEDLARLRARADARAKSRDPQ